MILVVKVSRRSNIPLRSKRQYIEEVFKLDNIYNYTKWMCKILNIKREKAYLKKFMHKPFQHLT